MARLTLKERISKGLFLLDGAMGTQFFARGIKTDMCSAYLNITSPDIVFDIHQAYLQAGSDAVITNTFSANKYVLARYDLAGKIEDINKAAVEIAKKAAGDSKYVLGGIGPAGDFLKPLGNIDPQELKDAFAEQANTLLVAGVDGFIIETMAEIEEAVIAIEAVRSVSPQLPLFVSFAFDRAGDDFKTMMGLDVETVVSRIASLNVDAVGFNCGKMSLDDYIGLAKKYASTVEKLKADLVLLAEPNAGQPELDNGQLVYNVSGQDFAEAIKAIHSAGVTIIGGCCGTSPELIEAAASNLKQT